MKKNLFLYFLTFSFFTLGCGPDAKRPEENASATAIAGNRSVLGEEDKRRAKAMIEDLITQSQETRTYYTEGFNPEPGGTRAGGVPCRGSLVPSGQCLIPPFGFDPDFLSRTTSPT